MDVGIALGVIGLALSVGFGVGAMVQAHRSQRKNQDLVVDVGETVRQEVISFRRAILGPPETHAATAQDNRTGAAVAFGDVLNTGETMLLVIHPAGNRGSQLRVFGWRNLEFKEVASLGTSMPRSFTVGDLDRDGRTEIATLDVDFTRRRSNGESYAMADGVRRELLYRWNGNKFDVVAQHSLPIPAEDDTPWTYQWHRNPIEIPERAAPADDSYDLGPPRP